MPSLDDVRAQVAATARVVLAGEDGVVVPEASDGVITVPWGSSVAHLRVVEHDGTVLLTVLCVVLDDVPRTPELLGALNDMNAGIVSCRVFWADGAVLAATDVPAADLQPAELEHALWATGSFADWADTELQPRFGGRPAGG